MNPSVDYWEQVVFLEKVRNIVTAFCVVAGVGWFYLYDAQRGYSDLESPVYHYVPLSNRLDQDEKIQIVTYNLQFCEKIDLIVEDIERLEQIKSADLFLFQEVVGPPGGPHCVQELAEELNFYASYAPAMRHPKNNLDFGNAILSRWPIVDVQKFILPNRHLIWKTNRVALKATVQHPQKNFDVVTVHLETLLGGSKYRTEQAQFVFEQLSVVRPVLVSGDWNTFSKQEIEDLERAAKQHALVDMTKHIVQTRPAWMGTWKLDHTFGRGFKNWRAGVVLEAKGSDHLPLWHEVELLDR
ncbi:MAG: hypothetical protein CMK59_11170 [Proteobacteria bacterium]|nr:hypothetical protein [Pseudomonadota bacterium]